MKAVNQAFTTLIGGNKQFVIPVFQRDYSWTPEQCEQLWFDVLRAGDANAGSPHFMGSIVQMDTGRTSAAFGSWMVIDGQQRLTTLTLLLTALRDCIHNMEWVGGEDSPTEAKIDAYFLKNTLEKDNKRHKLALRRHDDATLRALVNGEAPESNSSQPVMDAYDWFAERLQIAKADLELIDRVYRGIDRLEIVEVTLDRNDHPQLVFESLNSTGVDLTQSDLIRNYILMGLSESEQTRLYEKYWSRIEHLFRNASRDPDFFLRDYVVLKTLPPKPNAISQPRRDRIYDGFKEFTRKHPQDLEELLQEMVQFAGYYLDLVEPRAEQNPLFDAMHHVRSTSTTTHAVLGMKLYSCHKRPEPTLSQPEFEEALRLIESYVVRRAVLGLQNRSYWDVFTDIARSIDEAKPLQSMKVAFARRPIHLALPHDDAFKREVQECNLYDKKGLCWNILARLENDRQKETTPLKNLTIEHIMPQSVGEILEWQEMLGGNWGAVHEVWLNRLGNLTLTACNSEMGNRPFAVKKTLDCGFEHSAVRLNGYVRRQEQWTEAQIKERGELLAHRAISVWPHHHANADLVRAEEIKELREKAAVRDSSSLKMSDNVRKLFNATERKVAELGDVISVIDRKSVCCYTPEFVVEIMPMGSCVRLILPLEFDEVRREVPDTLSVADTTDWKFVPNRVHTECTMLVDVWSAAQLEDAMPIVRQAYEQATGQS